LAGDPTPIPFNRVRKEEFALAIGNQKKAQEKAKKAVWKQSLIKTGFQKYIEFWEYGMTKCARFARDFGPYVEYWKVLEAKFNKPLSTILSSFIQKNNCRSSNMIYVYANLYNSCGIMATLLVTLKIFV
jgi:hypothetical protein